MGGGSARIINCWDFSNQAPGRGLFFLFDIIIYVENDTSIKQNDIMPTTRKKVYNSY